MDETAVKAQIRRDLIQIIVSKDNSPYTTYDHILLFATHSKTESGSSWVNIRLRIRGPTYNERVHEWSIKRPVEEDVLQEVTDVVYGYWLSHQVHES